MRCLLLLFSGVVLLRPCRAKAPYLRDRPRGLGLLQLPTGMSDERSGPFVPNLYIAGNKAGEKPAAVPDVSLPGQAAVFSGRSAFHPFMQAMAVSVNEDISDAWGLGFALNGVNHYGLNINRHYDQLADVPYMRSDGGYQPFTTAYTMGGEFDPKKIREVSGHFDLPLPGLNELFDLDGRIILKSNGYAIYNGAINFPLTLSDPNERGLYTHRHVHYAGDRHMQYGHVVPSVNLYLIDKDKIVRRLKENRANPAMIG